MYVCVCKAITSGEVLDAVRDGARCLDDLSERLGVSTGCGGCAPLVQCLLDTHESPDAGRGAPLFDSGPRLVPAALSR
jgi:bacterioferritin-associated ferredoxin